MVNVDKFLPILVLSCTAIPQIYNLLQVRKYSSQILYWCPLKYIK
jgi:hypothetical protein